MLTLMYITNNPKIALIAQKYGVDRVWVDLETIGKGDRQKNMDSVQSHHTVDDIRRIAPLLDRSQMLVRVNPWHDGSAAEIDEVIDAGGQLVMLPMWKTVNEVEKFIAAVNGRAKVILLLETREAEACLDKVLTLDGVDEIHIGLNDLHISYGLSFMFELLANGTVERICRKLSAAGIPYGFGGIAKIGEGMLPAERILYEHYRLGSGRVILSRSFCDADKIGDIAEIERIFAKNVKQLRKYEESAAKASAQELNENRKEVVSCVEKIASAIAERRKHMDKMILDKLTAEYGDAFYVLDSAQFRLNFAELKKAFSDIYDNFNIAYSYKTNYTPKLCRIVDELGGYAEVVSDMEAEIALRLGVSPSKIIFNGPYKNYVSAERLLISGGTVNIDSVYELAKLKDIIDRNPEKVLNLGLRVNFDVGDGVTSRFGFDTESDDFKKALKFVTGNKNVNFTGLQCHFATRRLDTWRPRAQKMLALLDSLGIVPEHIDLGGGLFGKMHESLKVQFDSEIPTYEQYAQAVAPLFAEHYGKRADKPLLLIEPGSALVGDCMRFVSRVVNIKTVRGKNIATLLGSIYNINPTLNKKNPPIEVVAMGKCRQTEYNDLDFGGFTCIESDYLYRHYNGELAEGDIVIFGNVGSYSVVLKPPFILPNFPVIDISGGRTETVKRGECFDDLFHTFGF